MERSVKYFARKCADSFSKAVKFRSDEVVENELGRFKIWAGNLGIFASGNASADHRLRNDESIKDVIIMLLTRLDKQVKGVWQISELSEDDSLAQTSPKDGSEAELSSASISPASSDTSEDEQSSQQDGRRRNGGAGANKDISNTISQLYRLSALVKKSHSLQEKSKVEDFIHKEKFADQVNDFGTYAKWKVERMFPNMEHFLLERLTAGLTYRQNKLLYRKLHREKLNYGVENAFDALLTDVPEQRMMKDDSISGKAPRTTSNPALRDLQNPQKFAAPSTTNASSIDQARAKSYPKSVARSRLDTSVITSRAKFDVPRPPLPSAKHDEVRCPYCPRILTKTDLIPSNWTFHILKDIDPYMCIFPDCDESTEQYRTQEEWVGHMQRVHNTAYFCPLKGHETETFRSLEKFDAHMKVEHHTEFTEAQLPTIQKLSCKPASSLFGGFRGGELETDPRENVVCPFCPYSYTEATAGAKIGAPSRAPSLSNNIQRHIARHLEEVALLSIPEQEEFDATSIQRASETVIKSERSGDNDLPAVTWGTWSHESPTPAVDLIIPPTDDLDWSQVRNSVTNNVVDHNRILEKDPVLLPFVKAAMIASLANGPHAATHEQWRRNMDAASREAFYRLLRHPNGLQAMIEGQQNFLLCTANDQTVRAIMSCEIIEYLNSIHSQGKNTAVCYVYLDSRTIADYTVEEILSHMLKQLLEKSSGMPSEIIDRIRPQESLALHQVSESLKAVVLSSSNTFVVVDASVTSGGAQVSTRLVEALLELQVAVNVCLMILSAPASHDKQLFAGKPTVAVDSLDPTLSTSVQNDESAKVESAKVMPKKQLRHDQYTCGWICVLSFELEVCRLMLDEEHHSPEGTASESMTYSFGRVAKHNIVIASGCDGAYGTDSAAVVAQTLLRNFPNFRFIVSVGIGGGVPTDINDVRLGDVVVSTLKYSQGGRPHQDSGIQDADGFPKIVGSLNAPPTILMSACSHLQAMQELEETKMSEYLFNLPIQFRKPTAPDRLFYADYGHVQREDNETCARCDARKVVPRADRETTVPEVHYGMIASVNRIVKDAVLRDKLALKNEILCFEMHAAGLANNIPCIAARGICDYCDSHRTNEWQHYAAASAAAWAKEMMQVIPAETQEDSDDGRAVKDSDVTEKQQADVLRWLSPPDPQIEHAKALSIRSVPELSPFLATEVLEHWASSGSSSFYCLEGAPGSGKTILTASIVEHLLKTAVPRGEAVAFYYFAYSDMNKRSYNKMIRSLTYQLSTQKETGWTDLWRLYLSYHKEIDLSLIESSAGPSNSEMESVMMRILGFWDETWLVIDAIDECESDHEFVSWLARALTQERHRLNILVTSRLATGIQSELQSIANPKTFVSLRECYHAWITKAYTRHQLYEGKEFQTWGGKDTLERLATSVAEKANSSVGFATCLLDLLSQCRNFEDAEGELESLPRTLEATYGFILRKISSEARTSVIFMLQLLLLSQRPLRVAEAIEALDTHADSSPVYSIGPVSRLMNISGLCRGLLIVTQNETKAIGMDDEVRFAHSSVEDYLQSDSIDPEFAQYFSSANVKQTVVMACLIYLMKLPHATDIATIRHEMPWAQQAAEIWYAYAAEVESDDTVATRICLFATQPCFSTWLQLMEYTVEGYRPYSPLTNLAYAGLWKSCYMFIEQEQDMQLDHLNDALYAASSGGHLKTAQVLLYNGADANARSGIAEFSALQVAAHQGHTEVIKLLLGAGARIDFGSAEGGMSALQVASRYGKLEAAKILVEAGAHIDQEDDDGETALQSATREGHLQVVKYLIEHGADVNAISGSGVALVAAASEGHLEVVHCLLDAGADIELVSPDRVEGNALQAASAAGHEDVVKCLLDRGANVNTKPGSYSTALQAATRFSHAKIVQMLRDAGAES